jgi:Ca-activated chloride channel family protein
VIDIPAPQGSLLVVQEGRNTSFPIIVKQNGSQAILNTQNSNEPFRYLKGSYEVETLTLPRRKFTVAIEADQTKTITLPAPGLVNINTISTGYGSLFEITDDGSEKWVCHLEENRSSHSFNLLPGTYRVAFRVRAAGGSKYTTVKTFELRSGQTANLNIFN